MKRSVATPECISHAEIYEWQIAALLATAQVDAAAKARIVGALGGEPPAVDTRRVTRLEQELRAVALDNAFGRMTDEVYLRRKSELAAQIEAAHRPEPAAHTVDPKRALGFSSIPTSISPSWVTTRPSADRMARTLSLHERSHTSQRHVPYLCAREGLAACGSSCSSRPRRR